MSSTWSTLDPLGRRASSRREQPSVHGDVLRLRAGHPIKDKPLVGGHVAEDRPTAADRQRDHCRDRPAPLIVEVHCGGLHRHEVSPRPRRDSKEPSAGPRAACHPARDRVSCLAARIAPSIRNVVGDGAFTLGHLTVPPRGRARPLRGLSRTVRVLEILTELLGDLGVSLMLDRGLLVRARRSFGCLRRAFTTRGHAVFRRLRRVGGLPAAANQHRPMASTRCRRPTSGDRATSTRTPRHTPDVSAAHAALRPDSPGER
jgi:hypothetical protein